MSLWVVLASLNCRVKDDAGAQLNQIKPGCKRFGVAMELRNCHFDVWMCRCYLRLDGVPDSA